MPRETHEQFFPQSPKFPSHSSSLDPSTPSSDPVKVANESSKQTRNKQAMETPVNKHKLKPGLRAEAFNYDYCNF
jgi:hypothetical protein